MNVDGQAYLGDMKVRALVAGVLCAPLLMAGGAPARADNCGITPIGEPVTCTPAPIDTPAPSPAPSPEVPPLETPTPVDAEPDPRWLGTGSDRRPCVSRREYRGVKTNMDRAAVESRWEVKGLGRVRLVASFGRAWIYPRCGYGFWEEAFYGAAFDRKGLYAVVEWKAPDATMTGRP